MRVAALVLLLWGCSGEGGQAEAHREYLRGRALLERGEPAAAVAAFSRGAQADPRSPSLLHWQAWAQAEAGDLEGALAALSSAPRELLLPEMIYNQAAWSCRLGRLDEAEASLRRALAADEGLLAVARDDDDLEPIAHLLPSREVLQVEVEGEAGAILLGGTYRLHITLLTLPGERIVLSPESDGPVPFRVEEIVEDRRAIGDLIERRLSWRLRALEAGEGELGPWMARSGAMEVPVPGVRWHVVAPEGMAGSTGDLAPASLAMLSPAEVFGARPRPWAEVVDDRLVVATDPGSVISVGPHGVEERRSLVMELRHEGQRVAVGEVFELAPEQPAFEVEVRRGAELLLHHTQRRLEEAPSP